VLNEQEIDARYEIYYGQFIQTVLTKAKTLLGMVDKGIIPALCRTLSFYSASSIGVEGKSIAINRRISECQSLIDELDYHNRLLSEGIKKASEGKNKKDVGKYMISDIRPLLDIIKDICNQAEHIIPRDFYPFPTIQDLIV
jgi:glutamine synthetase type III